MDDSDIMVNGEGDLSSGEGEKVGEDSDETEEGKTLNQNKIIQLEINPYVLESDHKVQRISDNEEKVEQQQDEIIDENKNIVSTKSKNLDFNNNSNNKKSELTNVNKQCL